MTEQWSTVTHAHTKKQHLTNYYLISRSFCCLCFWEGAWESNLSKCSKMAPSLTSNRCFCLTCMSVIQFQWREDHHRVEELAAAEDTNLQYFNIAFWNHLKYLNYLYGALFPHPSFCLCLLCCVLMFLLFIILTLTDTGFTFFLRSTAVKAHAQSSFNICSNPCSSCRLNGSYFWFPPPSLMLLMLQFRRSLVSHTHLSFQCKSFHFPMLKWLTK